ncbi:MAG: dTDP-4-dehydrorhamnose reductase [Acidobacteria bacterium]|nr:dTDP-4-dehydrorhamnose reductase [Acidobacteriota bacterium]
MSQKVVIFGSSGQLGVELGAEFTRRGYAVRGFTRSALNITDAAEVDRVLTAEDPAWVLNAAAYNHVDVAEKEPLAALQVNALAVRNIAVTCRQLDARLVHFSTDYVFDGAAGRPYREGDTPHPLSAYAVSKLAGELYAQAYLDHALILRTSGVYGPAGRGTARGNFIEVMLRLGQSGQPIRVVEDHFASPTYAPALAARTADLVARNAHGLYHAGGGAPVSWFEFARMIFRAAGLAPELRPSSEREYRTPARRPIYSALENARMAAEGIAPMPPIEEAIVAYLAGR